MTFKAISPTYSTAPQLSEVDVARAAKAGFKIIVCARPDGEDPGQPTAADMALWASRQGMAFTHIPVTASTITDEDITKMAAVLSSSAGPVLGYCRSGARAAVLWALAQPAGTSDASILASIAAAGYDPSSIKSRLEARPPAPKNQSRHKAKVYDVAIVGGGSAGIATAASLVRRRGRLAIAVIEPASDHFYQPGWTMVGAGVFTPEQTRHTMASAMPDQVTWIRQAAATFSPETNEVVLADGSAVTYRVLVAAPGLKLDWTAIPGLTETLGQNGVTSNYRFDLAPYTYKLAQSLKRGRALFTQPAMPIKCAGAPQKAMYLSSDIWSDAGVLSDIEVEFHNAGAVLFGVPTYVPALMDYVKRYGIALRLESKLVAVDGPARTATLETKGEGDAVYRTERGFNMLHTVPPQVAPDFIRASPLAAASGFIDVDQATLRHVRYPNIYALGDACSAPNAKTVAAARKQAPVVAVNVLSTLDGGEPIAGYDGYGACPLTVERGKIVLAEFGYGGKVLPTFPSWLIDGAKPSRAAWFLKARVLPPLYWQGMLKGREWMVPPHMIDGRAA